MTLLMGGETEYAIAARGPTGDPLPQPSLLASFMAFARERLRYTSTAENGRFLANGGKIYLDAGLHVEAATPECGSPYDVVRYLRANDEIIRRLCSDLLASSDGLTSVFCARGSVDYCDRTIWASHESYLHRTDPRRLPAALIPFLASRVVLSGAGGWDMRCIGLQFTLSPRAPAICELSGTDTQRLRPLFHTKNETLSSTGTHRLHVCCSETLCSDMATALRFGSTALVLAIIDAGAEPGTCVRLKAPLYALHRYALDPTCRTMADLVDGRRVSAIQIQRAYLAAVEARLGAAGLPDWAPAICALWRTALDDLDGSQVSAGVTLDWAIKRKVYTHRLRQYGLEWSSLHIWNAAIRQLRRAWAVAHDGEESFDLEMMLGTPAVVAKAGAEVSPMLERHGFRWDQLADFAKLRTELLEIDTRFSDLSEHGVFRSLDAAGVLRHRVSDFNLDDAIETPPQGTRAAIRGAVVRRLSDSGTPYSAEWTRVFDLARKRVLDLGDPFEHEERWLPWQESTARARV
jgi:Pup-ligase protein